MPQNSDKQGNQTPFCKLLHSLVYIRAYFFGHIKFIPYFPGPPGVKGQKGSAGRYGKMGPAGLKGKLEKEIAVLKVIRLVLSNCLIM